MAYAFSPCVRPWRSPCVAGRVAGALVLGVVAAAAAVMASPRPVSLPLTGGAAVRQADALRGTPCAGDDDCGGYAVFPPLWCRRGEGADTPTCRAYVAEGEACSNAGVLCDATSELQISPLSCVDGTCSTFVTGGTRGDTCPIDQDSSPCADGHTCRFVNSLGGDGVCVSVGAAGNACGGPLAVCSDATECIDGETGEACPLTRMMGAPPFEVEERDVFPKCTSNATAAGGTCRAPTTPTVGTPCTGLRGTDDVCARSGDDTLFCSIVSRARGLDETDDLRCVKRTAPGAPCTLSGASEPGVCSDQPFGSPAQLCIDKVCVPYPSSGPQVSSLGNECYPRDGCSGGDDVECVFADFANGQEFANGVCFRRRVPVGGACGVESFGLCDADAGLTCKGDVCVAGGSAQLGVVCDARLRVSCDPSAVRNRSGFLRCTGSSGGETRCSFECVDGDECGGEFDSCPGGRVLDGICVEGLVKGDPCDDASFACDARRGLFCRPIDGNGGGSGSNVRDVDGVCAVKRAVGATCDATTADQCNDGLTCQYGVCAERSVGLGEACNDDADCRNTADGRVTACWRGRGAEGKTCRAWRGPFESCASASDKCWRPALYCADDDAGAGGAGGGSVCVSAQGRGDVGAFCRLGGADCTAAADLFCATSRFTPAPVCKRIVGEGEPCDAGLGSDFRLCDEDAGLQCLYRGRFDEGPMGYFCQAPST